MPPSACAVRGGNRARASLLLEQWLLIEWPDNQAEPETYYLSTRPANSTLSELVNAAHQRWRIERDYQDLKSRTWDSDITRDGAGAGFITTQRLPSRPTYF